MLLVLNLIYSWCGEQVVLRLPLLIQSLNASVTKYCQGCDCRLGSSQGWKIVKALFLVGL